MTQPKVDKTKVKIKKLPPQGVVAGRYGKEITMSSERAKINEIIDYLNNDQQTKGRQ